MNAKVIVATNNKNKLAEIRKILGDKFDLVSLGEVGITTDIEETGNTFYDNALIKAKTIADMTGMPALADDSGLEVDALEGRPGIYSARFAGEPCDNVKNNEKLLALMKDVPKDKRRADFISVVVLYMPDGRVYMAEGKAYGEILESPRGGGGFGYDPLFYSDELHKTFAEAKDIEKNAVSHRGRALTELARELENV